MEITQSRDLLTAAQTGGRLVRTEIWVRAGAGMSADRVHPHSEKRFEVLAGRMVLEREGRQQVLLAGERGRVPAGVPYRWCNGGAEELNVIVDLDVSPPAGA
jgi:mannose-6-phosphate isomerase-like protein (cupin superfamily)